MEKLLVADIGGTNARLALFDAQTKKLSSIEKFAIEQNTCLEKLINGYLSSLTVKVSKACLAIACPIEGDFIDMTNSHISFFRKKLQASLNLEQLEVINDFTAQAMSIPALQEEDVQQIGGNKVNPDYPIAIYGPGTGLGVANLIKVKERWITLSGEGGHVELPMINEYEDKILQQFRLKFGRVSAERFLSGSGLVNLYEALVKIKGEANNEITPAEIVEKALNNSCDICLETLTLFCDFMGRFGGNLALTLNSKGGIYITGGIVPRFIDFFKSSGFRHNFDNKGRMSYLLKTMPVFLITHSDPGLLGAGMYLQQQSC